MDTRNIAKGLQIKISTLVIMPMITGIASAGRAAPAGITMTGCAPSTWIAADRISARKHRPLVAEDERIRKANLAGTCI